MIGIQLDQPWYSSDWMLVELFNFVHPAHRRSTHAKSLIGHAKGYADQLGIPLVIGIISNHRTEAKVRLYRRMLPKAGEFFTYRPGDVASHRSPARGCSPHHLVDWIALMGGSSQTKTSTYKPDDQAYSAYSDILRRAQTLGQQPHTPYGGQLTAGWTPGQQSALDQTAGITGYGKDLLERAQGISEWAGRLGTTYQPYFDAATSMVNRGAGDVVAPMVGRVDTVSSRDVSPTAFSAAGLEKYLSPYTQNVIDSTMANIRQNDAVQQRNVVSDAIRQGNAFGGDRMGVAQAELARNQNLASGQTMANLSNAGYAQAMQAWQNEMASKLSADTGNADRSLTAARDTAGRQLQASISDADRAFAASRDNAGRSLQAAGLMATSAPRRRATS